jgi:hypothetical protein
MNARPDGGGRMKRRENAAYTREDLKYPKTEAAIKTIPTIAPISGKSPGMSVQPRIAPDTGDDKLPDRKGADLGTPGQKKPVPDRYAHR